MSYEELFLFAVEKLWEPVAGLAQVEGNLVKQRAYFILVLVEGLIGVILKIILLCLRRDEIRVASVDGLLDDDGEAFDLF